jgi:hypothetical protein
MKDTEIHCRFDVNKRNYTQYMKDFFLKKYSVKINNDLYFISGKFQSIFIDFMLNLTNVNQVLIDFIVNYEILTKDYSRF